MQLYQRAGQPALALKVCNSQPTGNSNAADDIIQGLLKNLAEDASEEEIRQCAEVCEKFGRPAEAVKLYARCNDFERAIAISMESRLSMTRELADLLTPPRDLFDGTKLCSHALTWIIRRGCSLAISSVTFTPRQRRQTKTVAWSIGSRTSKRWSV